MAKLTLIYAKKGLYFQIGLSAKASLFKKKNFTFNKSAFLNIWRFFTNECTYILKTSNFGPQGPQNTE